MQLGNHLGNCYLNKQTKQGIKRGRPNGRKFKKVINIDKDSTAIDDSVSDVEVGCLRAEVSENKIISSGVRY